MTPELREFYEAERQRILQPSPDFSERVLTRLRRDLRRPKGLWESTWNAAPSVSALAAVAVSLLVIVKLAGPAEPATGSIETFLDAEISVDESLFYIATDTPPTSDVLEDLMLLNGEQ